MPEKPVLDIQKTPDVFRRTQYHPRSKGRKFGMGVCEFWCYLFELNESLPRKRKMTDEEIKRQMIDEYPGRKGIESLGEVGKKGGKVTVNHYRQLYNKGKFTAGIIPEKQSQRYGIDGKPVNPRDGKPLSQ